MIAKTSAVFAAVECEFELGFIFDVTRGITRYTPRSQSDDSKYYSYRLPPQWLHGISYADRAKASLGSDRWLKPRYAIPAAAVGREVKIREYGRSDDDHNTILLSGRIRRRIIYSGLTRPGRRLATAVFIGCGIPSGRFWFLACFEVFVSPPVNVIFNGHRGAPRTASRPPPPQLATSRRASCQVFHATAPS